jgi:hypothetical protein
MKVKTTLGEMKDCEAERVSLVKYGANQTGLKIMKSNKEHGTMFDLSKLGKAFKNVKDEVVKSATELLGVMVMKGSEKNFAAITLALKSAGLKVETVKDVGNGAVVFAQAEFDEKTEGVEAIRLNDHVVAVVKGFSPYSNGMWESDDFDKKLKVEGLYQSVYTACSAFQSSLASVLQKAESPEAAKEATDKLVAKFGKYVTNTVGGLPVEAFKMADLIEASVVSTVAAEKAEIAEAAKKAAEAPAEKTTETKTETPAAVEATAAPVPPDFAKMIEVALAPVAKAISDLAQTVDGVQKAQSEVVAQVKEATTKAATLETKLKGTVISGAGTGDTASGTEDYGLDSEDAVMVGDTGFSRTRKTHGTLYKQ